SILSVRLVSLARAAHIAITPRQIFEHQTVAALAPSAVVAEPVTELETSSGAPLVALDGSSLEVLQGRYDDIEDVLPLSALQQGLFFHALEAPDSGAYREQLCLELEDEVDAAALEAAWGALLRRHAGLRVALVDDVGAAPLQVVRCDAGLPW